MTDIGQGRLYKTGRFLLQALGVIFCLSYIVFAANSAFLWMQMKWVRHQPLWSLTKVAEDSFARNKPDKLITWMNLRPRAEQAEIMATLTPYSGKISSAAFLHWSHWATLAGHEEDAVFWRQYARYRLRYDALRCGTPDAPEDMTQFLNLLPDEKVQAALEEKPERVLESIRRVLDFDARYPAENDPSALCKQLNRMQKGKFLLVPREKWNDIRFTLRVVSENYLRKQEAAKKLTE